MFLRKLCTSALTGNEIFPVMRDFFFFKYFELMSGHRSDCDSQLVSPILWKLFFTFRGRWAVSEARL